jgi:hypothetical protein
MIIFSKENIQNEWVSRRTSAVKRETAQAYALFGVLSGRAAKLTEAHYQQAMTIALELNIPNQSSHRGPTPEIRLNLLRSDSNRIAAINPHFTNTCLSTEEIRFETVSTCRPSAAPENASDELNSTPADSICSLASIALRELAGTKPDRRDIDVRYLSKPDGRAIGWCPAALANR